jgi:hypothetical protein
MATVGFKYIVLEDRFPGAVNPNLGIPANGWDNTAPTYPIGTKIMGYEDATSNPGWYTMMYLARADGSFITDYTADVGADASIGSRVCAHTDATTADGNEEAPYYYVSGDLAQSDATSGYAACAVACGTMADADNTNDGAQYGWFWVGGVAPITSYPSLDVSIETDGNVAAGLGVKLVNDATNGITFGGVLDGTYETSSVGYSVKTDA